MFANCDWFKYNLYNTNTDAHDFQVIPTPLNVSIEQRIARFCCRNDFVDAIHWRVNGTSVNLLNSPNISTNTMLSGGLLSIETLLGYNQTSVECVATFFDGSPPILTAPVMLLIQGLAHNVMIIIIVHHPCYLTKCQYLLQIHLT